MDILESKQVIMKQHCKTLEKFLRISFGICFILSIGILIYWGISALMAPESSFTVDQYGSDARVGFQNGKAGLYLMVANTSFNMGEYSCKTLYGIVLLLSWGHNVLFMSILWCLVSVFRHIKLDETPFTLSCSRLIRRIGLLLLGRFLYRNFAEAAVLFIWGPSTARLAWLSSLDLAFIGGIVLCLSYIFEYGVVLQQQSDETL